MKKKYNEVLQDDEEKEESKLMSKQCAITLCVVMALLFTIVMVTIGFICGFVFGAQSIKQSTLSQPIADIDRKIDISITPPQTYGIFPLDINDEDLTTEEKQRLEEAENKCANKHCCQEQIHVQENDDIGINAPDCSEKQYLECLDAKNTCVWDCSAKKNNTNNLHYIREFRGIDRHDAIGIEEAHSTFEMDSINADTINTNLIVNTVDECGTMYEYRLDTESQQNEEKRVKYNEYIHEESQSLHGKDSNDRRRLYVNGFDQRTAVTEWIDPYCKVVYISYQTNNGRYRCSGALISPRHVLTAGHCISDGSGNYYWDWTVYPSRNAGGTVSIDSEEGWVFNDWHVNHDWSYDMGIITLKVSNNANVNHEYFTFGYNNNLTAHWIFDMVGYPSDKGKIMQRQYMCFDYGVTNNLLYTQSGDNVGGNSGGPVFYENNNVIYGIVSHENTGGYNGIVRITNEKYDAICAYVSQFSETADVCN